MRGGVCRRRDPLSTQGEEAMPLYKYTARDAEGNPVKGIMEADGKEDLIAAFSQKKCMVTAVAEEKSVHIPVACMRWLKNIRTEDMLMFYVQFSNMISAGVTILKSLHVFTRQIENKYLCEAVKDVAANVESGVALSHAFEMHPHIFSKLFTNMIKAGEASGKLDNVLMRYGELFEKQTDVRKKVFSALLYPIILVLVGIAVTLFVVSFVIPQFVETYQHAGIALPLVTTAVYTVGVSIKQYWYVVVASLGAIILVLKAIGKTAGGRRTFDYILLHVPMYGKIIRKTAIARFARTLGTLYESGVPIVTALTIAREVIGNRILADVIVDATAMIEQGGNFSVALGESGEFPHYVVQMISVGEETGVFDTMLHKIADFYDMTVAYAIKNITTIIEPVCLMVLGSTVGFVMASMLLPMFDMIQVLKQ